MRVEPGNKSISTGTTTRIVTNTIASMEQSKVSFENFFHTDICHEHCVLIVFIGKLFTFEQSKYCHIYGVECSHYENIKRKCFKHMS